MNRIYRFVFVKALGILVVVSEITKGKGKGDGKSSTVGAAVSASLLAAGMAIGGDAFSQASPCPAVINSSIIGPCLISGAVEVANSITVTGGQYGLQATNVSVYGPVENSGTLLGTIAGLGIVDHSSSYSNGYIFNNAGGVIQGGTNGILFKSFGILSGTIENTGTIRGAVSGIQLDENASVSDGRGLVNWAGGLIVGGSAGISVSGHSTWSGDIGINNQGTISATGPGISISSNGVVTGGIYNIGTISSVDGQGVTISSSGTLYGRITNDGAAALMPGINNAGTIFGGASEPIHLVNSSITTGGILNSGTIHGSGSGIYIASNATLTGGITNTGSIFNEGDDSYDLLTVSDSGTKIVGDIVNSATGILISHSGLGPWGVYNIQLGATVDGSLINSGQMLGAGYGIAIFQDSFVTGSIINNVGGSIVADNGAPGSAIWLQNYSTLRGALSNAGIISGIHRGVGVIEGSTIAGGITNSGTISGGDTGINVDGNSTIAGGITNSGTITGGSNDGIYVGNNSSIADGITNSGTISGGNTGINVLGNSTISDITNAGLITGLTVAGIALTDSSISGVILNAAAGTISGGQNGLLANTSTIAGNISNSGLIVGADTGINLSSTSIGGSINNNPGAVISGGNVGVLASSSTIGAINNRGAATISGDTGAVSDRDAYGIYSNSTIGALNNFGSIIARATRNAYAVSFVGDAFITTLNNTDTITASSINGSSTGVDNLGTIVALNNSGTISANASPGGVVNGIFNSGNIGIFFNNGTVSASSEAGASVVGLNNTGLIDIFTNTGAIIATDSIRPAIGVYNLGTINTLNNVQGGNSTSAATTALNYYGNLPTNYKIGIVSSSHYGQLSVTNPVGAITNFGIYGSPVITTRIYPGVLSNTVTVINLQAKYDNLTLALVNNASTGKYDLKFTSLVDTQQSLVNTANALTPVYAMQNAVLVNRLTYDCTLFDVNNICISVAGIDSKVSSYNGPNHTGGLLIAAYRPHPNYRIGAYADQNLSVSNAGSTVKLSYGTPLFGIFGAWAQNHDGTGPEVRVSAAYGQKNATINRQEVGLSEPGSGSSTLNSQGTQVTAKYGFVIADKVMVSPYVGMRYTQSNMDGYTEGSSAYVTDPLTYSALNTNATTALAGVRASYKVIPAVTVFAIAAVETDTSTSQETYSATGIDGLTSVDFNPNPVRTRQSATVGAYYDIAKNQRFGVTGIYRQEAYQAVSSTTVMATYTVGL